jgi:tetratricopeptide (TPR) repeat protein
VTAAERERELLAQDEALQRQLVELRLEQGATVGDPARENALDAEYARVFRDYGVDVEGTDLVPALERFRERHVAEAVALALDDWGRIRRRVHGPRSEKSENLLYLAMDLDPDPERLRMRQAIFAGDRDALLELAAPESIARLEAGSIWVLSASLWDRWTELRPDVYRMYDQAVHLHPDDYVLQSIGGQIYADAGRHEEALACRARALALRPDDPRARVKWGDALYFTGRMLEAEAFYRAMLVDHPDDAETLYSLALVRLLLGDDRESNALLERSLQLEAHANRRTDLEVSRFFVGTVSRAEIARRVELEGVVHDFATYAYALLDHPDPAQRDPELVLRQLERRGPQLGPVAWIWTLELVARIRAGDWPGAEPLLEGRYRPGSFLFFTPNALDFMRAQVYARVGRAGEAREAYARGMAEWNERTVGDPAAWERSDVMRWRREAEAALGPR